MRDGKGLGAHLAMGLGAQTGLERCQKERMCPATFCCTSYRQVTLVVSHLYCAFRLADPHPFLKMPCRILGSVVDDASEKGGTSVARSRFLT